MALDYVHLNPSLISHPRPIRSKIMAFSDHDKKRLFIVIVNRDSIQLSPEGEVNSGGYMLRREASRYISTAPHRP